MTMSYVILVEMLNWYGDYVDSDISSVEILSNTHVEIDGKEYMVLNEDEAKEEFKRYQEDLLDDMGLDSFSEWAKNHIIENFLYMDELDDMMNEHNEGYIEDLKCEGELEEAMDGRGCETEEEFLESLNSDYANGYEYFKEQFGMDNLMAIIKENNLLDYEEIIDWIEETDGRGCLAQYDGAEHEWCDYYIYRVN